MSKPARRIYQFGPFQLDAAERLLLRDGTAVPLPPKVFDTLLALVENSGHLVEKDYLMARLWPDTFVEEVTLARNISDLRKALGEGSNGEKYIETVPKRGYRFTANLREAPVESAEMIIERHSRSCVVIEHEQEISNSATQIEPIRTKRRLAPVIVAACAAFVMTIAAIYVLRIMGRSKESQTAAAVRSIAVLPFKPIASDTRDEMLELGMADTLITRLSNIRKIIVRPIGAVRKYSALDQDPVAAGRELRVDAVLDASIQRVGQKIRVTARLTRVEDGASLWTYKCDEKCSDIFELQDSISEKVAAALALKLTGEEQRLLAKHHTDNAEAYRLYLLGHYHYDKRTAADIKKAIDYFEQAAALDPEYALAHVALCNSYASLGDLGALPPKDVIAKANDALERALKIDGELAEAHAALAVNKHVFDWDWSGADKEYKRALELNPNSAAAHHSYAWYLMTAGRFDEAVEEIKRARDLDPTSLFISRNAGQILYFARRYEEAIEALRKPLDMDSSFGTAHMWLAECYEQKGEYDRAVEEYLRAYTARGSDPEAALAARKAYAASGWRGFWRKMLDRAKEASKQTYVRPHRIAAIYARLGDKDEVFAWLERACDELDLYILTLKVNPIWDSYRSDPRFKKLLQRVRFAEE